MINVKKKKRGSQVLAGCLLLVLGVTSSMTVLAYKPPTIITEQSKDGEGNIYEMEPPIIQKDCAHTYVSGTSSEHIKSGSS